MPSLGLSFLVKKKKSQRLRDTRCNLWVCSKFSRLRGAEELLGAASRKLTIAYWNITHEGFCFVKFNRIWILIHVLGLTFLFTSLFQYLNTEGKTWVKPVEHFGNYQQIGEFRNVSSWRCHDEDIMLRHIRVGHDASRRFSSRSRFEAIISY